MTEKHSQDKKKSIAEQEKDLLDLLDRLTSSKQSAPAKTQPTVQKNEEKSVRDTDRFRRFTPHNPATSKSVWMDDVDEDDVDEDDVFFDSMPLVMQEYEDDEKPMKPVRKASFRLIRDEENTNAPAQRPLPVYCKPFVRLWTLLCASVPSRRDSVKSQVIKGGCWVFVAVCAAVMTYILYTVWWLPTYTRTAYARIEALYQPGESEVVANAAYPSGMMRSFRELFDRNPEVCGWISYHASGNHDFLDMEYPIMYSGNNTKYLTVDFNGNVNRDGAIFFDAGAAPINPSQPNRVLIAYGMNSTSGQMFAGLNELLGNVNAARVASTFSMNTLYANGKYKVFAVVLTDQSAAPEHAFSVHRTTFTDDEDFAQYVRDIRARSLYNYQVSVMPDDELLVLTTKASSGLGQLDNAYVSVIARRVRDGENDTINPSTIVVNDDVIMPYAWYINQNKPAHSYYIAGGQTVDSTTSTIEPDSLSSGLKTTADETQTMETTDQ